MSSGQPTGTAETRLLGMCSVLRGLLAGATRDEVLTRHRVGKVLCDLMSSVSKYGERALERAGAELGYAPPTLYRYVAVAETWTEEQLRQIVERTDRFGKPLSWSHLVSLTRVLDAETREVLLEQCATDGWTVRELAQHVLESSRAPLPSSLTRGMATPVREALAEGIRSATRASTDVSIFADALADRLADADGKDDTELFRRAIAAFDELRLRAEATLNQLQEANRLSETRLRSTLPVRVDVRPGPAEPDVAASEELDEEPPRPPTGARSQAPRRG